MNKLAEIRNQEMMCRERALVDTDRSAFWLAKADEWAQRANDEIASLFRESSGTTIIESQIQMTTSESSHFRGLAAMAEAHAKLDNKTAFFRLKNQKQ
jgi:hypothetical protein